MLSLVSDRLYAGDVPIERPVPYDVQAEEAVLGSLLLDRDGVIRAATFLQPGHFYSEKNGWIYSAILALYARREPPDLITLSSELARRMVRLGAEDQTMLEAVGGVAYLAALMHGTPTALHIEYYGKIVRRCAVLRQLIRVGGEIAGLGYETAQEPDALLTRASGLLSALRTDRPDAWVSLADVWQTNLSDMEARQAGKLPPGVPTGFDTLTAHTQGWQAGDLVVLAARTSRGKSALALHFAAAAADAGRAAAVISLEARKEAMGLRLLARESGVDLGTLRGAGLNDAGWQRVINATAARNAMAERVYFLDSPSQTVGQVEAFVEQLRADATKGCDLLIVDYLQLMRGTGGSNREAEVAGISRALKLLAMQAQIPVIALAQLNRAALGAEAPDLHHLRESGALEQDANIVLMLHRPHEDDPATMHLLLRKQRDGVADIAIPLAWNGALQHFEEA
jgi:replicative DNA helicase